jgi:hypothetical protein
MADLDEICSLLNDIQMAVLGLQTSHDETNELLRELIKAVKREEPKFG